MRFWISLVEYLKPAQPRTLYFGKVPQETGRPFCRSLRHICIYRWRAASVNACTVLCVSLLLLGTARYRSCVKIPYFVTGHKTSGSEKGNLTCELTAAACRRYRAKTSGNDTGNLSCELTAAACRGCVLLSCFGKKVSKEPTWGGADR